MAARRTRKNQHAACGRSSVGDQPSVIKLGEREKRSILSGGDVEDLAWAFVVAGDARADGEVSAATDEQLGNFRVHTLEVCQGVEDWGLPADAV